MKKEIPSSKAKPSEMIRRMANLMLAKEPVKTGNFQLDIVVKQLQQLAAHADAVDAFLDCEFEGREDVSVSLQEHA